MTMPAIAPPLSAGLEEDGVKPDGDDGVVVCGGGAVVPAAVVLMGVFPGAVVVMTVVGAVVVMTVVGTADLPPESCSPTYVV
jgi:hypothetical protein